MQDLGPQPGSHTGCEGLVTHPEPAGVVEAQPYQAPRLSPVRQQVPGAEERSWPHTHPRLDPSSLLLSLGRGPLVTLVRNSPLSCGSCPVGVQAGQGRWMAKLTTPTPQPASTPGPATPLHLTLPVAYCRRSRRHHHHPTPRPAPQEAGKGLGSGKGSSGPSGWVGLPLTPDREGVPVLQQGER